MVYLEFLEAASDHKERSASVGTWSRAYARAALCSPRSPRTTSPPRFKKNIQPTSYCNCDTTPCETNTDQWLFTLTTEQLGNSEETDTVKRTASPSQGQC